VTLEANPNYTVVSTNGFNVTPVHVTVIEMATKGDENLRCCVLVLSMAIPSTMPQQPLPSML
jgi:hypothetical protein